ncbi:MAG TPA: hypothetical protein VF520_05715 [Thermoleophilaceae bacterium]|jgi:hypothetical protein
MSPRETIVIRSSTDADATALAQLARLDSAVPHPVGRALVGEVDGELRAVLPLDGGRAIADPFVETAHVVDLLRAHATALAAA